MLLSRFFFPATYTEPAKKSYLFSKHISDGYFTSFYVDELNKTIQ